MAKLKIVLTVLAAVFMAAATVTTVGVASIPAWLTQVFEAGGMFLSWQGVQPWVLPQRWSAMCATLNVTAIGFVGSHAAIWGDGRKHVFLLLVAFAGSVLGVLARGTLPPGKAQSLPLDPAPPVPNK